MSKNYEAFFNNIYRADIWITSSELTCWDGYLRLEAEMRAEGKIIKRDFMSPEDKEWMEMDIEDTVNLVNGKYEVPWYENDEWIRQYGRKP